MDIQFKDHAIIPNMQQAIVKHGGRLFSVLMDTSEVYLNARYEVQDPQGEPHKFTTIKQVRKFIETYQ